LPDKPPLVSVIVATFNGGRFIEETIRSVLRQSLTAFELIVVDDGSTDDTVQRVKSIRDARIQILEQANQGAPAAMNSGIALARGRYVSLLDHDDLWAETALQRHVEFLERNPGVSATFSWSGLIDERGRHMGLHSARWRGPISFRQLLEDYVVGTSSSLVLRRDAVLAAGGFDADFPRCQDCELVLRMSLAGPGCVCAIPEELTLYRRHAGQMSSDWTAMQAEWNRMLEKCRRANPKDTAAAEPMARSNICRYWACLAYEIGNYPVARNFIRDGRRHAPGAFFADLRNWKVLAACLSATLLPAAFHRRMERLAGLRRQ
jgi:glycosyltransferase involved in cell wall biosynthesis